MNKQNGNEYERSGLSSASLLNLGASSQFATANRRTPIKMRAKMFNLGLDFDDSKYGKSQNSEIPLSNENIHQNTESELSQRSSSSDSNMQSIHLSHLDHNSEPSFATIPPMKDKAEQQSMNRNQLDPIKEPTCKQQYHPSDPRSKLIHMNTPIVKRDSTITSQNISNEETLPVSGIDTASKYTTPPVNAITQKNDKTIELETKVDGIKVDDSRTKPAMSHANSNILNSNSEIVHNDAKQTSLQPKIPIDFTPSSLEITPSMPPVEAKNSIRITNPIDIPPNMVQTSPNLLIYHSTPLPADVQHIISTVYTERCVRPRRNRDNDPCGCRPKTSFPFSCCDLDCVLFACQEECGPNCTAGKYCQNNRISRMLWKKVEVFDAQVKGRGLRALEPIRKGDFITEYVGIATLKKDLDKLFREYQKERMLYIMALDNQVYLDARTKGSVARYINHGCNPNCKVDRWKVRGVTRTGVFALKDIKEGEELMFDYKWDRRRGRAPTKCYCMAPNCRGTLELEKDKDLEEEEIQMKLKGYWKKPKFAGRVTEEVVNRVVKVYFEGNQEYFVGDVCKYDPETKLHMIIYKTDMQETWEDLNELDWMILDEEAEHMVIKRKTKRNEEALGNPNGQQSNVDQGERQFYTSKKTPLKKYIIVQNYERDELAKNFIIDKCQRYFRVHVNISPCIRNNSFVDEEEAKEEEKALDDSPDNLAWKLTIVGLDPWKAMNYLEKNVETLRINSNGQTENHSSAPKNGTHIVSHEHNIFDINEETGALSIPIEVSKNNSIDAQKVVQEMIIPRAAADTVKKNLFLLRSKCWNVTINFSKTHSHSKSVAKLMLSAALPHDLKRAQGVLWGEMLRICRELQLNEERLNGNLFPFELGFLGGQLSNDDWILFLDYDNHKKDNEIREFEEEPSFDDLHQKFIESSIIRDFQHAQQCSIWVHPNLDSRTIEKKGSSESKVKSTIRIFIGCNPDHLPDIWLQIISRVNDLKRDVRFFPMIEDENFRSLLEEQNLKWSSLDSQFSNKESDTSINSLFQFLKSSLRVNVNLDPSTKTHLRLDAENDFHDTCELQSDIPKYVAIPDGSGSSTASFPHLKTPAQRILVAERILLAQLHIYRDHLHRQQRWIFGKDWSLLENVSLATSKIQKKIHISTSSHSFSKHLIDLRSVPNAVREICEIINELSLHPTIAAHAAIILHRYIYVFQCNSTDLRNQFKLRELLVACIFIANKAQKLSKHKRLEIVLKAAYRTFYSGIVLDLESEEAIRLENRTLSAEKVIIETLQYDIFWSGVDWMLPIVSAFVPGEVSQKAMEILLSTTLISVGPFLWLWSDVKYSFASIVGFIRSECLPALFTALELDSSKMLKVVDHLVHAVDVFLNNSFNNAADKSDKVVFLFKHLRKKIAESLPLVKALCGISHPKRVEGEKWLNIIKKSDELMFLYRLAHESHFQLVIRGVDSSIVSQKVIPSLASIFSRSGCKILFEDENGSNESIILEGSWRSIAIAEAFIDSACSNPSSNGKADNRRSMPSMNYDIGLGKPRMPCVSPPCDANNSISNGPSPTPLHSSSSTASPMLPIRKNAVARMTQKEGDLSEMLFELVEIEGRTCPGILDTNNLQFHPGNFPSNTSRSIEAKSFLSGNISDACMIEAGLRWWFSPRVGASKRGALCDILCVRARERSADKNFQDILFELLNILGGNFYKSDEISRGIDKPNDDYRSKAMNVSLQRWPSKKVETRERSKKSSSNGNPKRAMKLGFSAAALQEMQLFYQIHYQIQSPQGHPNFSLPIGIATPFKLNKINDESKNSMEATLDDMNDTSSSFNPHDVFKKSRDNKISTQTKLCTESLYLVFERTPFALQKILAHTKKRRKAPKATFISPALFSAWFHDVLSALAFAHMNNIVLRTVHPDQVLINEIGEAKISNLTRAVILAHEDREKSIDPLASARTAKKSGVEQSNDLYNNPYISPEMLLGSSRYTKESDIWSIGCLMAHLLVNKSLFSGSDGRYPHTVAIFKVVGTPSENNYPDAKKFPNYSSCKALLNDKVYKKGVLKALQFHLKGCKQSSMKEFTGAMDLLEKMLVLDPKRRIKPTEALQHSFMQTFASHRKTQIFRKQFQKDWSDLKEQLSRDDSTEKKRKLELLDNPKYSSYRSLSVLEKGIEKRRKNMLFEATKIDNDDDLYNLDEEMLNFRR